MEQEGNAMTLNSVQYHIRKVCKKCNSSFEQNKSRNKYYCAKYLKMCVRVDSCAQTKHLVDFWKTEGDKALKEAFFALTGQEMGGKIDV
jgi:hypothetical protein